MSKVTSLSVKSGRKVDFSKVKPNKTEVSKVKSILSEGVERSKMIAHNSFYTGVYGGIMVFLAFFAIKFAGMIASFVIGYETAGSMATVGDLVITYVTIIMSCGFVLFFGFKIENALLKALKKRLWHMKDGVCVKPELAKEENK